MRQTIGNDDFVSRFSKGKNIYDDILVNNITFKGMYELFNYFESQEESSEIERELEDVINEVQTHWFQYKSFEEWFGFYYETHMSTNIKTVEDLAKSYEMIQLYSYDNPSKKEEIIVCYP
tara:strand:- start:1372 stop:1731 length:360 start_codon:yes stop_codon:yes gene_type:complete